MEKAKRNILIYQEVFFEKWWVAKSGGLLKLNLLDKS